MAPTAFRHGLSLLILDDFCLTSLGVDDSKVLSLGATPLLLPVMVPSWLLGCAVRAVGWSSETEQWECVDTGRTMTTHQVAQSSSFPSLSIAVCLSQATSASMPRFLSEKTGGED
jgi:hypothetical protein